MLIHYVQCKRQTNPTAIILFGKKQVPSILTYIDMSSVTMQIASLIRDCMPQSQKYVKWTDDIIEQLEKRHLSLYTQQEKKRTPY